jgi:hypothetical protein
MFPNLGRYVTGFEDITEEECSFNLQKQGSSGRSSITRYRAAIVDFGDQKEKILAHDFLGTRGLLSALSLPCLPCLPYPPFPSVLQTSILF